METLVFLHALGASGRAWRPQVAALEGRYRILAPDLPGHGDAPGPFTMRRAVDAVGDLLAQERAHLVGISGGATVALLTCLASPERVASMVLSAPVARAPRLLAVQRLTMTLMPQPLMQKVVKGMYSHSKQEDLQAGIEDFRRCGKRALLAALRELAGVDARGQLAMIAAPVLVLRGARDRANTSPSAEVAAGIPHAELRVISGARHLWNLEQPELFSRTVDEFVCGVTGTGSPAT